MQTPKHESWQNYRQSKFCSGRRHRPPGLFVHRCNERNFILDQQTDKKQLKFGPLELAGNCGSSMAPGIRMYLESLERKRETRKTTSERPTGVMTRVCCHSFLPARPLNVRIVTGSPKKPKSLPRSNAWMCVAGAVRPCAVERVFDSGT